MQSWTKFFVVSLLVFSSNIYAEVKPLFAIDLSLNNNKEFKLNITSKSNNKEKYKVVINAPASDIRISSEKTEFTGELGPMDSEQFFVGFDPLQESNGVIGINVYTEDKLEKTWSFDYSVSKDDTGEFLVYVSGSDSNKQNLVSEEELSEMGIGIIDDSGSTKIIVNSDNRNNNFLRYILFVLSFFILGHLVYRILKED